jgi:hypothetical protein
MELMAMVMKVMMPSPLPRLLPKLPQPKVQTKLAWLRPPSAPPFRPFNLPLHPKRLLQLLLLLLPCLMDSQRLATAVSKVLYIINGTGPGVLLL